MSNKIDKIREISKELGDAPKIKKKKSLILLENIEKLLSNDSDGSVKSNEKIISRLESIKNLLNSNNNFSEYFQDIKKNIKTLDDTIKNKKYFDDTNLIKSLDDILEKIKLKEFPKEIKISNLKEFPKDIKVSNFPEQKDFPKKISVDNFPEEIKVSNQKEFPKEIKILNQKEFPKEIKVSNFPENQKEIEISNLDLLGNKIENSADIIKKTINGIKFPKKIKIEKPVWYEKFRISELIDKLTDLFKNTIFNSEVPTHENPKRAIAVKIVDDKGKIIKDLIPNVSVSSSGGGSADPVGLKDASDGRINPAKEDGNLSDIKTQTDKLTFDGDKLKVDATLDASDIEIGAVEIKDSDSDVRLDVDTNHLTTSKDERDNAICSASGNYGYYSAGLVGSRMTPFLTDLDDGDIAIGQKPQLVISEMHYFEDKSQSWKRWEGEDGYVWTYVTNFPETDYTDDSAFTVSSDKGVAMGGVATSDSVNPGDFGVFKITTDRSLVVTNDNITDGTQKTQIVDGAGNVIDAEADHAGKYHLAVTLNQDVNLAAGNSSSTNLAAGETWTGEPVSTFGVVGLQWNLNTDQNCTIYSEESEGSHTGLGTVATNGTTTLTGTSTVFERAFVVGDTISVEGETDRKIATIVSDTELTVTVAFTTTDTGLTFTHFHWDISYAFDFIHKDGQKGEGETVQATNTYWRLRVVNEGTATTTFFRVSGVLCPIATPLPSALSDDRRLKTETTITGRTNNDRHAWINPTNEQAVSPVYRMVGTNFDGEANAGAVDTNFWTALVDAGTDGTVVQGGGEVELKTSATATGWTKLTSVRKSRFVAGSAQYFSGGFNFKTAATTDNIRRVGAYTTTDTVNTPVDGFYFELNNATFSVNSRANSGTVSSVASGSFNGEMGLVWTPTADTYYSLTIEWTPLAALFYVNGQLLHKKQGAHQSYFMTLPITMENIYTSGAVDVNFETVGMYIARQGELHTNPTSKYVLTGTDVLKYGAGVLKRIIVSDNIGGVVIYDNTAGSGTVITNLDTSQGSEPLGQVDFDIPFNDGLTIVITGNVGVTVVYE